MNTKIDVFVQNLDKPYDEKDYPSLENITFDSLKEIFGMSANSSCRGMNNSLTSLAEVNKVSISQHFMSSCSFFVHKVFL